MKWLILGRYSGQQFYYGRDASTCLPLRRRHARKHLFLNIKTTSNEFVDHARIFIDITYLYIFPGHPQEHANCAYNGSVWRAFVAIRKKPINFHVDLERTLGKLPRPDVKMWDCVFSFMPRSIRVACLSIALENSQLCVILRTLLSDGNLPNILICRFFLSKRAFMLEIAHGIPIIHGKS